MILNVDCVVGMSLLGENSIDSVVTDPPYELGFMGKKWDNSGVAFRVETWAAALRVLKPGGYLLAFSGSRTYHRMVCAIEDAGFEIRDQIMWIYGSGFPKSHNGEWGGTALKPAHEPIVVARKPLIGTVEANWLTYGTGALSIDGCRVGWPDGAAPEVGTSAWGGPAKKLTAVPGQRGATVDRSPPSQLGRWPANVIHDGSDEALAAFPQAPGQLADARNDGEAQGNAVYGPMRYERAAAARVESDKSAARFFYCAKASKKDRNEGLEGFATGSNMRVNAPRANEAAKYATQVANTHPTVKPTDLMRYLCRLVTPPGGTVLDPFAGSGSTGKAAKLEGFQFLGFELSAEYVAIATARMEAAA